MLKSMGELLFKIFLVVLLFSGVILFTSGNSAEGLRSFFQSMTKGINLTQRKEITDDNIIRFQNQLELLKQQYSALEQQRQKAEEHAESIEGKIAEVNRRREDETGNLMARVLERKVDELFQQKETQNKNRQTQEIIRHEFSRQEIQTSDINSDLKRATQRLVRENRSDLRRLMEQYQMLEEHRKMMMETLKSNLDAARDRAKQADSNAEELTQKLVEGTSQNLRALFERLQEKTREHELLTQNRSAASVNVQELSQKIREKINDLTNNPRQETLGQDMGELNRLKDQQEAMVESMNAVRVNLIAKAKDVSSARDALEQAMIHAANDADDNMAKIKEHIDSLNERQSLLLDDLKTHMERSRENNQQVLMDIHERLIKLAQDNRENKEKFMEKVSTMRDQQREMKDRVDSQMQMMREKARDRR